MTTINPSHLLDQAERLLETKNPLGQVRQVDRRRAISAAYYAVFHCALTALADEFVGAEERKSERYGLAYRSIDHKTLEALSKVVAKDQTHPKYAMAAPNDGFGPDLRQFASLLVELKEKRISADYDPTQWVKIADARRAIRSARSAITSFGKARADRRTAFLTLLIFPPR